MYLTNNARFRPAASPAMTIFLNEKSFKTYPRRGRPGGKFHRIPVIIFVVELSNSSYLFQETEARGSLCPSLHDKRPEARRIMCFRDAELRRGSSSSWKTERPGRARAGSLVTPFILDQILYSRVMILFEVRGGEAGTRVAEQSANCDVNLTEFSVARNAYRV